VFDTADVAVVGAGIVGTTCAWLLAREGLRVTVFDGEGIGSGSSGHGHGALSLVGKDFRPGPHFELGRRSAAIYRDFVHGLIEDSGQDPLYHELPGLCAMGAWAAEADAWLGQHIPVRPLHGEVLNVRLPGPMLRTFILTARHGPILQRRDGIVLVGSIGGVTMSGMDVEAKHVFDPLDRSPAVYDLTPRPEAADLMIERALTVMPAIEDAELVGHLAGARPLSSDRVPIIGPVPGRNGVFPATGHGTKGIHLAPITARMIADYVLHGGCRQAGIDPAAFLPGRFQAEGRERAVTARFGGA
jgi:glycine/D-amino acid oxidase-like deaminating enzyme